MLELRVEENGVLLKLLFLIDDRESVFRALHDLVYDVQEQALDAVACFRAYVKVCLVKV